MEIAQPSRANASSSASSLCCCENSGAVSELYPRELPGESRVVPGSFRCAALRRNLPGRTRRHGAPVYWLDRVGKTHLAAAILRALVTEKAVAGLFCDYRELLKAILHSYNPGVADTELANLKPIFDAEVLVIDELGAAKTSAWVWETVALSLNTRYNDRRTTIMTTNYRTSRPALWSREGIALARASAREETLGDRIGERMRSRLQEICVRVEMRGPDSPQGVTVPTSGNTVPSPRRLTDLDAFTDTLADLEALLFAATRPLALGNRRLFCF